MLTIKTIISSGAIVTVECHITNSLPAIVIVGCTDRSVNEAKERVRGALAASKIRLPAKRIIVNLAPADILKEGSSFDLPILIAILAATQTIINKPNHQTMVFGEVGLNGSIKPIRGIIGKIIAAQKQGFTDFWIPQANAYQAQLIPRVVLYCFNDVSELYHSITKQWPQPHPIQPMTLSSPKFKDGFDNIVGQTVAKRALLIAAAGQHNIFLSGPPGSGKSLLAKALPSIMPRLTQQEMLDVTHIHSLANQDFNKIITSRPIRSPHHSTSLTAMLGGGRPLKPGELSLSYHGILFLDELPEFDRAVIESLRQPLEDKTIALTQAKGSLNLPADFLLLATANLCPCGYYGSSQACRCSTWQVLQYQKKISGPIADRIDLYVSVAEIPHRTLMAKDSSVNQEVPYRRAVRQARQRQLRRAGKLNNQLTNLDLRQKSNISDDCLALLNRAAPQLGLSARGYIKVLRVARTIADLEASSVVTEAHISEALQFRKKAPAS